MEGELVRLHAVASSALIDLHAEVPGVDQLLFKLEVEIPEEVSADADAGVQVPALERLEALCVVLAEERVLRVRPREAATGLRQERNVPGPAVLAAQSNAPDEIEEDRVRAVVELVLDDRGRERD